MFPTSTDAWVNPLTASGLPREHVLGREAIQNSTDAATGGAVVEIRFRKRKSGGGRRESLRGGPRRSEWAGQQGRGRRVSIRIVFRDHRRSRIGGLGRAPLHRGFFACGLGGALGGLVDPEDHFRRLCLQLGNADSGEEGSARGGSFGYGKSVYARASGVRTVIYYSRFEPTERSGNRWARLYGISLLKQHEKDGRAYSGFATFGVPGPDMESEPLHDEDANAFAARLGFAERGPDDLGTSILILDTNLDLGELRRGIETYWWPRLGRHGQEDYSKGSAYSRADHGRLRDSSRQLGVRRNRLKINRGRGFRGNPDQIGRSRFRTSVMQNHELSRQLGTLRDLAARTQNATSGDLYLRGHWGRYLCVLVTE